VPPHVWKLVEPYGLKPDEGERPVDAKAR